MKNSILGAIESAKTNGGVSYSLNDGILSNIPFYAISKDGYELIVPELTEDVVKDYMLKHSDLLADDHVCLGIWKNDDKFVLDITDLWRKDEWQLDGIREIGRLRQQISLFDMEDMEEIRCFDFEVWYEAEDDTAHLQPNNKEAVEKLNGIMPFKLDDHNIKNVMTIPFSGSHFESLSNDKDLLRLEMLRLGLSVLVHNK
jgi:hypothetical protein